MSNQNQPVRQRLLETLQQQVLPRLEDEDSWDIVFTEPPFKIPKTVTTTYHPGAPLSPQEADPAFSSDLTHNWAKLLLQSSRFPLLAFVAEGCIDWRIGITTRMAKKGGKRMGRSNWVTLGMPNGTFFLIPPGVPYAEPGINHWERSVQQGVQVKALWVQFHRFGMQCFTSYTVDGAPARDASLYIADSQTIFAAETLVEELNSKESSPQIIGTLLRFCLERLERALQSEVTEDSEAVSSSSFSHSPGAEHVARACFYMEAHYDQPMTLESVAAQVYISPSQLVRAFRAEKGMSVIEYLTRFRLENACNLLQKTDLRVNHIGKISGYRNHSYFCQVFGRRIGCSPQEYRNASIHKTKTK